MSISLAEFAVGSGAAAAVVSAAVNVWTTRRRSLEKAEGRHAQGLASLAKLVETNTAVLNKHLLDCAERNGASEAEFKNVVTAVAKMERSIEGLQRSLSNWMVGRGDRRVTIETKDPTD